MNLDPSASSSIELRDLSKMERFKRLFKPQVYQPLEEDVAEEGADSYAESEVSAEQLTAPFSWVEYAIFLLLGVAMLWAWLVSFTMSLIHCM